MCTASWRSVFYFILFCLLVFSDRWTGSNVEGFLLGSPSAPHTLEPVMFPHVIRVSEVKASHEGHEVISRYKRNIFYQSGLKLCGQETSEQIGAHHLSYFHLRVCQETIWEAFKIFWDRLPEQEEYQSWMSKCQDGTVIARDVGSYFSGSEEHQKLIKQRMSRAGLKSEPTRSWQHMCSTPTPPAPETIEAPESDEGKEIKDPEVVSSQTEENPLFNEITLQPTTTAMLEQVVELSILLTGEMFSEELYDPASLQFQTLSRDLAEKIEDALEGLPGFKSVSVIDFRPQKDTQGVDGIVVDYAVTVEVNGAGVTSEQLNYLTLQSNLVESSFNGIEEHPTIIYTISEVKNIPTEAFPIDDVQAVSEIPTPISTADKATVPTVDDLPEDSTIHVLPKQSETNTAATEDDVVVLEESEIASPTVDITTNALEVGGIEEEGLLLEDSIQTPASENILPDAPEPPVSTPPPDSPVEVETSGSGPHDQENLTEPPTTNAEDKEMPLEETALEEISAEEEEKVSEVTTEVFTVEPEAASPETTKEEGLLAVVPLSEAVDEATEASESEAEVLPVDAVKEVDEDEGGEIVEESSPEAPLVEDEPQKAAEDFTEDEILHVNEDDREPGPPKPTVLSPEKESPFTFIFDIRPNPDSQTDTIVIPEGDEIQTGHEDLNVAAGDHGFEVVSYGIINHTEEGSTGFPFSVAHATDRPSIAMPANPGRALMVFFSLRVTNMIFSEDLFNKSSAEYKALEQRFIELLVPYLQSNLSHFENLEILNFRNGSIVVNSRMKFGRPVARGVTTTVYLILEDFCNTAYQTMNLAIDKYSLDVESGDQADPCKFQACNEYAECKVNKWSGEAECVCNAGYFSVDGLPCQSICEVETDFCLNDGKCDVIPGQGAICRCRVGENWWYRGEHCEEYVSEPLVVGIAIASVAGFLLVASGVLFFLARTLRDQYDKEESEDPIRRVESLPSLERATKYNPMYESEVTTGYSHYYRRYPEHPVYSSASAEASTDFSSEEIRHIYENSELTKEEIQDRIRIIELYAKDRQFADFVRQHQAVLDIRRESSS